MAHKKLCKTCSIKYHAACALVNGCPCCEDTMKQLRDANHDADNGVDEDEEN